MSRLIPELGGGTRHTRSNRWVVLSPDRAQLRPPGRVLCSVSSTDPPGPAMPRAAFGSAYTCWRALDLLNDVRACEEKASHQGLPKRRRGRKGDRGSSNGLRSSLLLSLVPPPLHSPKQPAMMSLLPSSRRFVGRVRAFPPPPPPPPSTGSPPRPSDAPRPHTHSSPSRPAPSRPLPPASTPRSLSPRSGPRQTRPSRTSRATRSCSREVRPAMPRLPLSLLPLRAGCATFSRGTRSNCTKAVHEAACAQSAASGV